MREAYRLNQHTVQASPNSSQIWMLLYLSKEIPKFEEIEKKLKQLISRFNEEEKSKP